MRKKKLIYETGIVKKIAKEIGTSDTTVRVAFRFEIFNDLHNSIRKLAMEKYGARVINKSVEV